MAHSGGKSTPWVVIGILLFVFWPVALILLVKKLAIDRSATIKCGKRLTVLSILLVFIGTAYLSGTLFQGSRFAIHASVLIVGGVWLCIYAYIIKEKSKRYKKYIDLVVNQSITSISRIATEAGVSNTTAICDLKRMISAKYFPGAYIHVPKNEIIFMREPFSSLDSHINSIATAQAAPRTISCKSCGANNRIHSEQLAECDYCGSPLD